MSRVIRKVSNLNPGESMVKESVDCPIPVIESIIDGVLKTQSDSEQFVSIVVNVDICVSVKTTK